MVHIETYVFFDLETTGIPRQELNKTRITEISMIAVKQDHLLDENIPRVQQKLTLCLNPRKLVSEDSTKLTGLCNFLLEYEPEFNERVFSLIDGFLSVLTPPICLIAYNGLNFDYPILQNHLNKLKVSFSMDILCADALHAFYYIENKCDDTADSANVTDKDQIKVESHIQKSSEDELDFCTPNLSMQSINETTPKTLKRNLPKNSPKLKKARKQLFPWHSKPKYSYSLTSLYERILKKPAVDAHRAESDCLFCLEISVKVAKEFVKWVEKNHKKFSDIDPMVIGYITLTGLLWGCTNPFIKRGTRGLRDVTANSAIGQLWAEVVFLLGNWRYVIPWLVNQSGSLCYLAAVQRAPLSVAVPAANGLAFAFTALTASITGLERPLDKYAMLGIGLVVSGTAMCCYDQTT